MNQQTLDDKVLGCLIGAAAGDAMGCATEARSEEQILEHFGHRVVDFEAAPSDTFGAGNAPGQFTDDFSSAYFIARAVLDGGEGVSPQAVKRALLDWSDHAVFFDRFAGPTTRTAIARFKRELEQGVSEDSPSAAPGAKAVSFHKATNGAAMHISPIGLLDAGDVEQAIADAVVVTMVTHRTYLAVSGACAVAAAVSEACRDGADLYSVLQAGLYGAKRGEQLGREAGDDTAGPSVLARMELAIDIGLSEGDADAKVREVRDLVGCGLHISEAVPCAFGIVAANAGRGVDSVVSGVNVGYDTDTIATMAGAIAGALSGAGAFPAGWLSLMEQANGLEIERLAQDIAAYAANRQAASERAGGSR